MSKSSNSNKQFMQTSSLSRADQLRLEKQRKIDDNNIKISKQLEKSANSWQNSMEQVRRIAKKSQDSSQILDNVFTENEYDRTEMEIEQQRHETRSNISERPFYNNAPQEYAFRPTSQYANSSNMYNQFMRNRSESVVNNDPRFYQNQHSNFTGNPNVNLYPKHYETPQNPQQCHNYPFNAWQSQNMNQSNLGLYQPNFNPAIMRSNYGFPNSVPRFQSGYQPEIPYHFPGSQYRPFVPIRGENSAIESMKMYVTSLLDKLEILNDTVAKLKRENENNNHRVSRCLVQPQRPASVKSHCNHAPVVQTRCCCQNHSNQPSAHSISRSYMDLRRPPSSISQHSHAHSSICNYSETAMSRPFGNESQNSVCHRHAPFESRGNYSNSNEHNCNASHTRSNTLNCHPSHGTYQNYDTSKMQQMEYSNPRQYPSYNPNVQYADTRSKCSTPGQMQTPMQHIPSQDMVRDRVTDNSNCYTTSHIHTN